MRTITVNAPTPELAMQLVGREMARRGVPGRVTAATPAPEQLPNDRVSIFVVVPPVTTYLVTVEVR